MRLHRSMIVTLTIAGALGGAVAMAAPDALAGGDRASGTQQTHPSVRPRVGRRRTTFELIFTVAQAPGRAGFGDTYYREVVSPPARAPESCSPTPPAPVFSGPQGTTAKIALRPPAHGWCRGRYQVTVFVQRTPTCGPPLGRAARMACPVSAGGEPEIRSADLDTGQAHFRVR
jgi:hypothetical protein